MAFILNNTLEATFSKYRETCCLEFFKRSRHTYIPSYVDLSYFNIFPEICILKYIKHYFSNHTTIFKYIFFVVQLSKEPLGFNLTLISQAGIAQFAFRQYILVQNNLLRCSIYLDNSTILINVPLYNMSFTLGLKARYIYPSNFPLAVSL